MCQRGRIRLQRREAVGHRRVLTSAQPPPPARLLGATSRIRPAHSVALGLARTAPPPPRSCPNWSASPAAATSTVRAACGPGPSARSDAASTRARPRAASRSRSAYSRRSAGSGTSTSMPWSYLQPGQQRAVGVQRVGQQQPDAVRPAQLQRLLDQLARHRRFLALLRGRPLQQPPGDDHRPLARDADQADQAEVVAQAAAVDGVDLAPDQLPRVQRPRRPPAGPAPGRGLDPPEGVPQGVGMAGQRLGLPAVGVAMAVVVARPGSGPAPSPAGAGWPAPGTAPRPPGSGPARAGTAASPGSAAAARSASPARCRSTGELIQGVEDAQLDVQGDQLVEGPAGHRRGQVRPLTPPQGRQHRLPVLAIPDPLHRAPPRCATLPPPGGAAHPPASLPST